jgi:hypothetical protein
MRLPTFTQPSARVIARVVAPNRRGSWLGGQAVDAPRFFTEASAADVGAPVRQKVFVIPMLVLPGAPTSGAST